MNLLQSPATASPLTVPKYREIINLRVLTMEYLPRIVPSRGAHSSREDGVCAMELAAWLAGEPHTDSPSCVCPTITRVLAAWNDEVMDFTDRKNLINSLIPLVIGTNQGDEVAMQRHYLALNRVVAHHLPIWLQAAGLQGCTSMPCTFPKRKRSRLPNTGSTTTNSTTSWNSSARPKAPSKTTPVTHPSTTPWYPTTTTSAKPAPSASFGTRTNPLTRTPKTPIPARSTSTHTPK